MGFSFGSEEQGRSRDRTELGFTQFNESGSKKLNKNLRWQQQSIKHEVALKGGGKNLNKTALTVFHRRPQAVHLLSRPSLFLPKSVVLARSQFDSSHTQYHQLPLDRF